MFGDNEDAPRRPKSRRLSEVKPSKQPREPDPVFEKAIFSEGDDDGSEYVRRHRRVVEPDFDDEAPSVPKRRSRKAAAAQSDDGKPEHERAHEAALRILSYGANTRSRLIMKLVDRGFSEEAANTACDVLEAEGVLSDRREINGAVMRLGKRYGPSRIPMELRRLGFDSALIREVDYELLEVDFISVCRKVISSRGYDEKTRAYLRSHGFTDSQIREAAKNSES